MSEDIREYINKYGSEVQNLFIEVRELIIHSVPGEIEEKLWAKLPSYYFGNRFVRIIPFKDHINIVAEAIIEYKTQLVQYKLTPKGILQIYLNQDIPKNVLATIFRETLKG